MGEGGKRGQRTERRMVEVEAELVLAARRGKEREERDMKRK